MIGLATRNFTSYTPRKTTEVALQLDALTFDDQRFSQPDAVRLTRVNAATLDNWLRYEHVDTWRDDDGRRVFSFADLLRIDCMEMLNSMFKMPPKVAADFGRRAVESYRAGFEDDRTSIALGSAWPRATRDMDAHFTFARSGSEVIEVQPGDDRPDSVMLVLPTRMIARRLLAEISNSGDEA